MNKFFVGTQEGSGTHLLLWLLESHPQIKANRKMMDLRTLAPKDPPAPADRLIWVTLNWLKDQKFKKVILLTRNPVNAISSAYRRFWTSKKGTKEEVALLHFRRHQSTLFRMEQIESMLPSLRVMYEDLVTNPKKELKRIAEFLGLHPTVWKYDVSKTQKWFGFSGIKNRNGEGWKQDEHFKKVWEENKGVFNV